MVEEVPRELIQLSALLGKTIGQVVDDLGVNKLGILVRETPFEITLASSTLSSFLASSPSVGSIFFPNDVEDILSFDPHLLFFATRSLPNEIDLNVLQEAGLSSDVLLLEPLAETIGNNPFWTSRDVFVLSIQEGRLVLSKYVANDLEPLFEYILPCDLASLLKRVNPFKEIPPL